MVAGLTYYQICWYFIIYSFLGWCVEVIYHAVSHGKILNRGFLNGPVCPVYGFGMLAVLTAGNILEPNGDVTKLGAGVIFLGGMVLATAVELLAGWILDTFCHARWWDYSKVPFNFRGYICLQFSLYWGLGAILVVQVVHPLIAASPAWRVPETIGWWCLALLYILYLTDFCATVATIRGFNRQLAQLNEVNRQMRILSDAMSRELGANSLKAAQAISESRVQAALARMELRDLAGQKTARARVKVSLAKRLLLNHTEQKAAEARLQAALAKMELRDAYETYRAQHDALRAQLLRHSLFGTGRILRAFPELLHRDYNDVINELRQSADNK